MKRKSDWVMRTVGNQSLLVPLGAQVRSVSGFISLNRTAAYIWELLAQECTLDQLTAAVLDRFKVDSVHVGNDVRDFLVEITRLGLVEP